MKARKAYLKPIHQNAFHHPEGLYGEIVGILFIIPDNLSERLCYKVYWPDKEDYIPLSEVEKGNYEIVDTNK